MQTGHKAVNSRRGLSREQLAGLPLLKLVIQVKKWSGVMATTGPYGRKCFTSFDHLAVCKMHPPLQ